MKKVVIIGASGLVGSQLIGLLINAEEISQIISLGRRTLGITHPKLQEIVIDFDQPEHWKDMVQGDVLFSCLGTTLANAGSKDAQYKVDFTYQYEVAKAGANNGINTYVLVSSAGASAHSKSFYTRMKGELDEAVQQLNFSHIHILRPGQLDGNRKEKRKMEKIALRIMHFLNNIGLFRRYRPIMDLQVAKAMLKLSDSTGKNIYTLEQVHELAGK